MIRRACEKDIPMLKELLRQVCSVHANGRPDLFIDGATKYTDEELTGMVHDDDNPIFINTGDDDQVRGYAFCQYHRIRNENNRPDRTSLYIDDLCVDEKARRQHVGEQLYHYVLQVARESGCDSVELNVWELNQSARAFYDRMGLRPLKTTMEAIL